MRPVERTVEVLEALAAEPLGLGVVRLASRLNEPPSSIHRLLVVLRQHGLVVQDNTTRHYRVGPSVLRLAQTYMQHDALARVATPCLDVLQTNVSESAFLTELIGDEAICVASSESQRPLRFFIRPGQRMPFNAAASAKAILAFQPPERAEHLIARESMQSFTQSTIVTSDAMALELEAVRRNGYAICDQELEVGITAISVPLRDAIGRVVASITVVAPQHRLDSANRRQVLRHLFAAAADIERAMGYPVQARAGRVATR